MTHLLLPLCAAFVAGAMNSVAGGGTFVSFPALIFAGVPPIPANATNSTAMWVGQIGSVRGYKEEVVQHRALLWPLLWVSIVGALIGAVLLLVTPSQTFSRLIPWLMLLATAIFVASPFLQRARERTAHAPWQFAVQFCVAIYGGYFGAGMSIVILAVLAFSGFPDFNSQNAIKNALGVAINGVALIPFAIAHVIDWRFAVPMAAIALLGGYFGARLFRRLPQSVSRTIVIAIGVTMTVVFFVR